ncbi:hypothetical protein VCH24_64080 [Variovorax boronicumulans]|nr:hypothetical protein VCH24_64080 [Variovorax boronicumulans]
MPRTRWTAAVSGLCLCGLSVIAHAERTTATAPGALSTQARLDFTINIDKFLYLQVGAAGATINEVGFTLSPLIPATPTSPVNGSNRPVIWSGAGPIFAVAPNGNVLPVTVRSNAGQVTLRATAVAPLVSGTGTSTIALSQISVNSSDPNLPAPPLDGSTSVNVVGSAITERTSSWTFTYAPSGANLPAAGTYTGQVTFTASAP